MFSWWLGWGYKNRGFISNQTVSKTTENLKTDVLPVTFSRRVLARMAPSPAAGFTGKGSGFSNKFDRKYRSIRHKSIEKWIIYGRFLQDPVNLFFLPKKAEKKPPRRGAAAALHSLQ
ncbi:MAG: hypothetical protein KC553_10100 [Nitrospina sp.]|nr:hypothetical protein [Nitrospina sp.]